MNGDKAKRLASGPRIRGYRMTQDMKQKTSAWIRFGLKLGVTIALVVYLLGKVDLAPVLTQIRSLQLGVAAIAIGILFVQLALVSLRWLLVNRLVDAHMPFGQVFRLTLIGQFFNQVLPSAVGGDAVRAWLSSREGVPLGRAVTAIVCDRAVALVVLVLIISVTFLVFPRVAADSVTMSRLFTVIALLGLCGLAGLFIFGNLIAGLLEHYRTTRPLGKLIADLRKVLFSTATSGLIIALSTGVQFLLVVAIYLCAKGMGIPLSFGPALLVVPAIMLVSMIPVSYGGWGVREGAMIFGLGQLGVAVSDALAISVTYGLMQIALGLPGGALWLARTGRVR